MFLTHPYDESIVYPLRNDGIPIVLQFLLSRPFGFAGLYETWTSPGKKEINTCAIITTDANELIKPIHDRMPVILPRDKQRVWLDSDVVDATAALSILRPYPAEEMNSVACAFSVTPSA